MRRLHVLDGLRFGLFVLVVGCAPESPPTAHGSPLTGLLGLQNARCAACHELPDGLAAQLAVPAPAGLAALANRRPGTELAGFLAGHFGRDRAADIAAWQRSLAPAPELAAADVDAADIERGRRLVAELGCGACHDVARFQLESRTDHARLTAWLHEPDIAHVPLSADEARAAAAFLLRDTRRDGVTADGFAWRCHERKIEDGDWPDLTGLEPAAEGVAERIDLSVATREHNYALEFTATLDVPATGEWQFATSSDDGSWLWIDGRLVVDNPGLKPTRRAQGKVQLDAGPHQLRVAYTQAGGGAALAVLWSGPGVDEQEVPASLATCTVTRLVPPPRELAMQDGDAIQRGRTAARAARCDRCHEVRGDEEFAALPAPPAPKAWTELGDGACVIPAGAAVHTELGPLPERIEEGLQLQLAMALDGCLSCHVRDGAGGLPEAVARQLVEVEDLGDEGRLPPDLSDVGRRLRRAWIERVIGDGHKARDYVRMRMPAYGAERAARYASWLDAVDAADVVDEEPPFSAEAVELGRQLAGTGGRNCISCHTIAGHPSLGAQGMDLLVQHERLRPGWFRDWLLKPTALRPDTRMPSLWITDTERDRREVDAMRSWLSLGMSAPLPKGVMLDPTSLVLEPIDRVILHGAFLEGVSARCLAVGTPLRAHFAYDLDGPALAWVWRGHFLDARGTWFGRAGALLEPLGGDRVVVDDFEIPDAPERRLLGQRRTADGYPVLRVRCGDVVYEDRMRPVLTASGVLLVRTLRCEVGTLRVRFPSVDGLDLTCDGAPAAEHELVAGDEKEFTYRW